MHGNSLLPAGRQAFNIKVDAYAAGELKGRLGHSRYTREIPFDSFIRLVMIVEEILDTNDCPESADVATDFFTDPPKPAGLIALTLEVLFRDNHSWQGRLRLDGEKMEASFRSVLELITLLEEIFGE